MERRHFILGGTAAALMSGHAIAQPEVAKVIVGFPPGGGTDALGRAVAARIAGSYFPNVIVDNKPGAGGRIGIQSVKTASPDGATVLFTPGSMMVVYPHIYKSLPYDALKDFVPVSTVAMYQFGVAVGPGAPASIQTVEDLVQWCKSNKVAFASPAAGSLAHFTGVLFARMHGLEMQHVAYKGSAPAMQDVLGGQVPVVFNILGEYLPHMKSGRLRVLASSGKTRSRHFPNVPTFQESGMKDFEVREWVGVMLPAKTPQSHIDRLRAGVKAAMGSEQLASVFNQFGAEPFEVAGQEFSDLIRSDLAKWGTVVQSIGFTADE